MTKWNVTPLLSGGSNFYLFTDLECAHIGINAWFALPTKEGGKEKAFRPIRVQYILRVSLVFHTIVPLIDLNNLYLN